MKVYLVLDTEVMTPAYYLQAGEPRPQEVEEEFGVEVTKGDPERLAKFINNAGGFADLP